MAAMADVQRLGFDERIRRIQTGGPNTSGTIYIGPQEGAPKAKERKSWKKKRRARIKKARPLDAPSPLLIVLSWPFAFLIGALCMFAGRVALFQLTLQTEALPPEWAELILLTADIGVAAFLLIALGWAFSLERGLRRIMLCAGFLAFMLGEAFVIRQAPDAFVPMFSEDFVAAAVASSAPLETMPETWETVSNSKIVLNTDLLSGVGAGQADTFLDIFPGG
ncbi:MAG: hypothetical protein AAGK37_01165 [Pseudomonadota bacterium]